MKMKKNWKLWGLIFVCFVVVWIGRASYLSYYLRVERVKSKYELEIKKGLPKEDMGERFKSKPAFPLSPTAPSAPVTSPKQPVDVWGWVVKVGGVLTGLKTLLDILDKLKSRAKTNNPTAVIPINVPEGSKVTITIVIKQVRKLASQFLMYPFRFLKR